MPPPLFGECCTNKQLYLQQKTKTNKNQKCLQNDNRFCTQYEDDWPLEKKMLKMIANGISLGTYLVI